MMRMNALAFFLILTVAAGVAWSGSPATVVDDVVVREAVGDNSFVLEDGRTLLLRDAVGNPEFLVGRSLKVIATVDPSETGNVLLRAGVIVAIDGPIPFKTSSDDDADLEGTVASVGQSSFAMSTALGDFQVVVDDDTEYHDLEGLSDLDVGDRVRVKGDLDGSVISAEEIRLLETDDDSDSSGVVFESTGQIVDLTGGEYIGLADLRTYTSTADTIYSHGLSGYGDLRVGMTVEIKAARDDSGMNLALEVKLRSDNDGTTEIEGQVESVDSSGFLLVGGLRVVVVASTVFDGDADRLDDLRPGWRVEVEAYQSMGELTAQEVDADDSQAASIDGEEFEPHQALVVLAAGAVPSIVAERYSAVVLGEIGDVAVLFWWDDEIDDQLLLLMDGDPEIAAVEPNYLFRDPESVRRRYVVVDREHRDSEYTDQSAASLTRLATAHLRGEGSGSVVAVLDTGVDPNHPALAGKILPGGLDLVDGDSEPWESRDEIDQDGDGDLDEAAGHGTFVSSIILLVAPDTKILPYRVLDDDGGGSAYLFSLALADAIARHVDIVSLSLVYQRRSAAVDLLLEQAGALGIAVVAAAGNDGLDVLPFPASDRHTIAVTGLSVDGASLATFANRSPEAWLAAPSDEIYGAVDQGRWGTWSGTSMAVPFVAGALAILHQIDPGLDPGVSGDLLEQSGQPLSDGLWTGVGLNVGGAASQLAPTFERRPQTPPNLQ